jgi:LCP family protein required for cell wall assembly
VKTEPDIETKPAPRPGDPRGWRRAGKIALIGGLIIALLLGAAAVGVYRWVNHKFQQTHREDIRVDPLPGAGQPVNILVLGSDRRDVVEGTARNLRQFHGGSGGQRSDTIILIHVAGDGRSATALSFPRDLRVQIPGKTGFSKINAAYNGGPNLVIDTIKQLTGLPVHHYVEVNFAAFRNIVNAIGGVVICVTRGYEDIESGLYLPGKGCYNMNGDTALAFARMRKADPEGDFGRIKRQQLFMRTLMSRLTSISFLTDLPRLIRLVNAVVGTKNDPGIITDKNLKLSEVKGVANKLAGFKQSSVDFRIVPSLPKYLGGVSFVIAIEDQAKALYKALLDDTALPPFGKTGLSIPQPADVSVRILNGSQVPTLGKVFSERLGAAGFRIRDVGEADRHDYGVTYIYFAPGAELKAKLLEDRFPGSRVRASLAIERADILIILGNDAARLPA